MNVNLSAASGWEGTISSSHLENYLGEPPQLAREYESGVDIIWLEVV